MVKAQYWVKARNFSGIPTKEDFKLVEEDLPELKDGDVLFEAVFLTVDPYMRFSPITIGGTMPGQQVARVIQSRNTHFPEGSLDGGVIPDLGNLPSSLALGTIGMPGVTAHVGLLDYGLPKSGETVLVNAAAGAVGGVVGQIAKIKFQGCKVIGYAGTDDKVKWLKEELGFDFAFNYKKVNLSESLKEAAPEGVDVYYDNVGGDFSNTVITKHMKMFGRVVVIGIISSYNLTAPKTGPELYFPVLMKRLSIRGFGVPDAPKERWLEAYADLSIWVKEGKMKYCEHITTGFDKMPEAFIELFTGANTGKAIVKI